MKHISIRIVALGLALAAFMAAAPAVESPAETSIRKAREMIRQKPDHVPYYNALAMAYARRARETSDVAFYQKAEDTLTKSFELSPNNIEGLKVRTWLLLGRHEFARALEVAARLNKQTPDDVAVYGYLVDANAELGNYPQAVEAAQWMLNIRPGNVPGLTRAAYLRELHGDLEGAMDLMQSAYDSVPFQESEDRAWLLTQLSHLNYVAGNLKQAEMYASGALQLFPGYHYALGALAQVRVSQMRYDEAVMLLQQRADAAPHAENLYSLADALDLAGRHADAATVWAQFETKALAESNIADNANHELIAYYSGRGKQAVKAVEIAEKELARRHDIFTLDCYAQALAAAGDYAKAEVQIQKAQATGVKDPKVLAHAGEIEMHLNTGPAVASR
jgi:tetratricopeptide (TPR) repeat protein